MIEPLRRQLSELLSLLDQSFLERQTHARLALLSLLSGHHLLMLGPPGTAKSLLARAICLCVKDGRYFEYLLSRFTHPDELFGPVSIPGLKEEDYRRLTEGYLPEAHVAFLDEVFKANSAILNSLLTLINERVFHHGLHRDHSPLRALIGASNEPPDSDALAALYDRFLIRVAVQPLASNESFLRVSLGEVLPFDPPESARLSLEDLAAAKEAATRVAVGDDIRDTLVRLREALRAEEIDASDRRWRWAMELVKVSALTSGREHVEMIDLLLLQYCFGTPFETDAQVQRVICRTLLGGVQRFDVRALEDMATTLRRPPSEDAPFAATRLARLQLLDSLEARCDEMARDVDQRRAAVMGAEGASLWLHEIPSELYTAILLARTTLRETLDPLRALIAEYRPRLRNLSLVGRFFGAFVLQTQLHSVFYGKDDADPIAWVSGPDEPPQRWAGLMPGGRLVIDPERLSRARLRVQGDPWHDEVLHIEVNDDALFSICRRDDWRPHARQWFLNTWNTHAPTRGALPDRDEALDAVVAMLEHYRSAAAGEGFPLPEE